MAIVPPDNEYALLTEVNGLLDEQNLAPEFVEELFPAPVTALPASGEVGESIYYKAAEKVYWLLYYTGESTEYPWNTIGPGIPLYNRVDAEGTRENAAYGDCTAGTTTVPTVTTPLKGDYVIEHGCFTQLTGLASSNGFVSIEVGASAATDEDACRHIALAQFSGSTIRSGPREKTALAASTAIKQKYKGFTETRKWAFLQRWISLYPLRVG